MQRRIKPGKKGRKKKEKNEAQGTPKRRGNKNKPSMQSMPVFNQLKCVSMFGYYMCKRIV